MEPMRQTAGDHMAAVTTAKHPDFRASIERGRAHEAAGQVKTIAEVRRKYVVKKRKTV